MHRSIEVRGLLGLTVLAIASGFAPATEVKSVSLPVPRASYFQSERIEFSVACGESDDKPALVDLRHQDGSVITLKIPSGARGTPASTRPIFLRANSLKPGRYTASPVGAAPRESAAEFSVAADEHANAMFLGQWVHTRMDPGVIAARSGWMFMNGDYVSLHPRTPARNDPADAYVAASARPFALMILGGGHQLDLDLENDWGDPWVQRAIIWRMQLGAISNRIYPIAGLHAYDEPGLTWWKYPATDGMPAGINPFIIPHQLQEFEKLSGVKMPSAPMAKLVPQYAANKDAWLDFMAMRMKYLEQMNNAVVYGTRSVQPSFEAINQVSNSYAPGVATDGVDSRLARPFSLISAHGGYSDMPVGTIQPIRSVEAARGFAWDKPVYYLPMWYTHSWATIRNSVWMSMLSKFEGLLYTPEQDFALNNGAYGFHGTNTVFEIAEINRQVARIGDVLRQLPKTPAPVALIYSSRQVADDIVRSNTPNLSAAASPEYASPHRDLLDMCFLGLTRSGVIPNWIDEAEVDAKGAAFLKQWKVIYSPGLHTATPAFRKALEEYVAGGGRLVQLATDTLKIPGATTADYKTDNYAVYFLANLKDKPKDVVAAASSDSKWRDWVLSKSPTFAADVQSWVGLPAVRAADPRVLVNVHRGGKGQYIFYANDAQDPANPRTLKHELIGCKTQVLVPGGGVVYDLVRGGKIPVKNGTADIDLAAGDGGVWLQVPKSLDEPSVDASINKNQELEVTVKWECEAFLPFRLRVKDPSGQTRLDLFRSTAPTRGGSRFVGRYPLGVNAQAGNWVVEVDEWLTGSHTREKARLRAPEEPQLADVEQGSVLVRFDDARRIADLLAAKPFLPPFDKLNVDSPRVFGLDPRKFAVLGQPEDAEKLAAAMRSKGLHVDVNPGYEVKPFVREPNRGGAGPIFRDQNFENLYSHTIVLPGHPLLAVSNKRGHLNRLASAAFPGPGKAFVQWSVGAYQAGWQNVFVQGDTQAGIDWLIQSMNAPAVSRVTPVEAGVQTPTSRPESPDVKQASVARTIELHEAPVAVVASFDGKLVYALEYDGQVSAINESGKTLWKSRALLEGASMALSPRGDRLAVGGYPGVVILEPTTGKVLGGKTLDHDVSFGPMGINLVAGLAWNDAGDRVAGGWINNKLAPHECILLDADGKEQPMPPVAGNIGGVAFVPGKDILLVGGAVLTAIDVRQNKTLWTSPIASAAHFDFASDGKTLATGGWGRTVAVLSLEDGKIARQAAATGVIGGVVLLPDGSLVYATWGGTEPLRVLRPDGKKPEPFFSSEFAFQSIMRARGGASLIAAEQGGAIWTITDKGLPLSTLSREQGSTVYSLASTPRGFVAARMNRSLQFVEIPR